MESIDDALTIIITILCGVNEGKLSPEEAVVFFLHVPFEYGQEIIAVAMGRSQPWVSGRIRHVVEYLRSELGQ